ncbi:hypothetical protein Gasu2_01530 [Galdieria sulphuraria]|nr:hypothetical protein Gasu2_01530 [Galdieria sulphuraria]
MLYIKTPVWRSQVYSFLLQKECKKSGNSNSYERNGSRSRWLVISLKPIRKYKIYLDSELISSCASLAGKLNISESEERAKDGTSSSDKVPFNYYQFYDLNPAEPKSCKPSLLDLHKLERDPNTSPNSFPTLVLNADFQPLCF